MKALEGLLLTAILMTTWGGLRAAAEQGDRSASRSSVRIAQAGIEPATVEVGREDVVSWKNTSVHIAVVSFPASLRERFVCDDLSPTLAPDGQGRIVSAPIRDLPFALPCPLEPGDHAYTVHLLRTADAPGVPVPRPAQIVNPSATHEGIIRVQ